jgi:uncharacterized membrane protein
MIKNKLWHLLFLVAVFFKGLDGALELLGGLALLLIKHGTIIKYVNSLFYYILSEDPDDPIAAYLINYVAGISKNTELFAAIYLLGHGIIKVGIVTGLYLKKLWVYPLAELILALFVIYQLYRFSHTSSILLLLLTVVDAFIIFLIWKEYRRLAGLFAS